MDQGDAISRSAVLDVMPKDTELLRPQVVDVICNTPALDVVPAEQGKWISVKDRLPDDERRVLVSCRTKKGQQSVNLAYYWNGYWHGQGSMAGVTHWMPLPEPPKEGSNEQHPDGL